MSIIAPSAPTRRRVRSSSTREERRKPGRPRQGNIKTWETKSGDVGYGVRFVDQDGVRRYERCGLASEGWSLERAQVALEQHLEDVRRGVFRPTEDLGPVVQSDPLFADFAREYLAEHVVEIDESTDSFYDNMWRNHLMPAFGHLRLSEITYERIRQFKLDRMQLMKQIRWAGKRGVKLRTPDGRALKLSEKTINHSIATLSQILSEAVRREGTALAANQASHKGLRVKVPRKAVRDWLERDELRFLFDVARLVRSDVRVSTLRRAERVRQLLATGMTQKQVARELGLSEGAVQWLAHRPAPTGPSVIRMALCLLGASGARNVEICRLRPIDLDFPHGKIRVGDSKTPMGVREIDITPWLQKELKIYLSWLGEDYPPRGPLLPNDRGGFYNKDTLNKRIRAVEQLASAMRLEHRLAPLPTDVTAHVFRRTYITMMLEAGAPPSYVQQQVGHVDAHTTVHIYSRVLRTCDRSRYGRAFDEMMIGAVPESVLPRQGGEEQTHLRAA